MKLWPADKPPDSLPLGDARATAAAGGARLVTVVPTTASGHPTLLYVFEEPDPPAPVEETPLPLSGGHDARVRWNAMAPAERVALMGRFVRYLEGEGPSPYVFWSAAPDQYTDYDALSTLAHLDVRAAFAAGA